MGGNGRGRQRNDGAIGGHSSRFVWLERDFLIFFETLRKVTFVLVKDLKVTFQPLLEVALSREVLILWVQISQEQRFNLKFFSDEVYCTNALLLL